MNNQSTITGTIFAINRREVPDKKNKNNGKPWLFTSIIIETDHPNRQSKTFPEFELGTKATPDDYAVGDQVEITYYLEGEERSWDGKDGQKQTKNFTKIKAMYIKHPDTNTISEVGNDTATDKRRKAKADQSYSNPLLDGIGEEEGGDAPF
jgi:hypothetical protein